jgi:phosphatidylglycerophosphate synthase
LSIQPTLKDIVDEYKTNKMAEELRGDWAIALTCRHISIPPVWLLARLGISPLMVTSLSIILALLLPVFALYLPLSMAGLIVCLTAWMYQVLDCVDGALARITKTTSKLGGRIDFLADMAQWGLLYVSIGILADRHFDNPWTWTVLAAIAAWLRLFARVSRDAFKSEKSANPAPFKLADLPIAAISGLSGLIPFFALLGSWLGPAVSFLVVYSLLDLVDATWSNARAGSDENS